MCVCVCTPQGTKRRQSPLDVSQLRRDETFGVQTEPSLSTEMQSVDDGHGPVVFQPERVGRIRGQSVSVQRDRRHRSLRYGDVADDFSGKRRMQCTNNYSYYYRFCFRHSEKTAFLQRFSWIRSNTAVLRFARRTQYFNWFRLD